MEDSKIEKEKFILNILFILIIAVGYYFYDLLFQFYLV